MKLFYLPFCVLAFALGCNTSGDITTESDNFDLIATRLDQIEQKLDSLSDGASIIEAESVRAEINEDECGLQMPDISIGGNFFRVSVVGVGDPLHKKVEIGMNKKEIFDVFGGPPDIITAERGEPQQYWWYGEHFRNLDGNPDRAKFRRLRWFEMLFDEGQVVKKDGPEPILQL